MYFIGGDCLSRSPRLFDWDQDFPCSDVESLFNIHREAVPNQIMVVINMIHLAWSRVTLPAKKRIPASINRTRDAQDIH